MLRRLSLVCAVVVWVAGCSDDDGDKTLYPDLGALPDIEQKEECESEWIDAVIANNAVSTGDVATTEESTVYTTKADASAGGMMAAASNPYLYLSLKDGTRVDITDIDSRTSTAWDLAMRRTVIRINGGDSGPGQGAVARITGKSFDEVTEIPDASAFTTDEFIDETCKVARDPISNIQTSFSGPSTADSWYEYDQSSGTHDVIPKPIIWVLQLADGSYIKMEILSFKEGTTTGYYTLKWQVLASS